MSFVLSTLLIHVVYLADSPIISPTLGEDLRQTPIKISTFLAQIRQKTQVITFPGNENQGGAAPTLPDLPSKDSNGNNPFPTQSTTYNTPIPTNAEGIYPTSTSGVYPSSTPFPTSSNNSGSFPTATRIPTATLTPTRTPTPTITPTPSPSPTPMHPQALEYFNSIRRNKGLPELYENNNFSIAAQKHAHYMSINHDLTHVEDQSKSGYTQEGANSAKNSNLCSFVSDLNGCINSLMADPPHEQFMVDPNLKATGFGLEGGYGVVDVLSGI